MDVEGTSECNLAAIDKYSAPVDSWSHILHKLCKEGVYSREVLLDRTLSALERDWPQFRAGSFSRFHGGLAPNMEIMSPHSRRYLALSAAGSADRGAGARRLNRARAEPA